MEDKLEGKKILAVDDDPDILDTLEELLPVCKVVKASTFDEAKEQLQTQAFDIAILDIMGVDGYTLLGIATKKKVIAAMLTQLMPSAPKTRSSLLKERRHITFPRTRSRRLPSF